MPAPSGHGSDDLPMHPGTLGEYEALSGEEKLIGNGEFGYVKKVRRTSDRKVSGLFPDNEPSAARIGIKIQLTRSPRLLPVRLFDTETQIAPKALLKRSGRSYLKSNIQILSANWEFHGNQTKRKYTWSIVKGEA